MKIKIFYRNHLHASRCATLSPVSQSLLQQMRALSTQEQDALLKEWAAKSNRTLEDLASSLLHDWNFQGRPEQQTPEGDWKFWLLLTGRRWGKTRTASEWVHKRVNALPKNAGSTGALLQRTNADVRDIMIEGPSGLLATAKPGFKCEYKPSKRQVEFHNGYIMKMYSAEEPDMLRGPTVSTLWADEFSSLKTVTGVDGLTSFENALFALSAPVRGDRPRGIITTTPRRVKAVKDILKEVKLHPENFILTTGSLLENIDNLDPTSVNEILAKFAGTSLGSQEIDGILVSDVDGAVFKSAHFDATRILDPILLPPLGRIVIAVDPSAGDGSRDECGISAVSISRNSIPTEFMHNGLHVVQNLYHVYILEDASIAAPPDVWARRVINKAQEYETRLVVAEGNQGREMVRSVIRALDPTLNVKLVHASVGKTARAEPVQALFAQGRAHIVGEQPEMEDQATTWVPGPGQASPDRMDAMVWGVTFFSSQARRQDPVQGVQTIEPRGPRSPQPGHPSSPRERAIAAIASPDAMKGLAQRVG